MFVEELAHFLKRFDLRQRLDTGVGHTELSGSGTGHGLSRRTDRVGDDVDSRDLLMMGGNVRICHVDPFLTLDTVKRPSTKRPREPQSPACFRGPSNHMSVVYFFAILPKSAMLANTPTKRLSSFMRFSRTAGSSSMTMMRSKNRSMGFLMEASSASAAA